MHGVRASASLRSRKVRLLFVVFVILGSIGFYAAWIEPDWIEVTHHSVAAHIGSPIKIAHLTDIHTSGLGRRERKMIEFIDAERPDLIVITGDSINITSDYPGFRDVLMRLQAPLGVWVVRGNHEDWWPVDNEELFYKSGRRKAARELERRSARRHLVSRVR